MNFHLSLVRKKNFYFWISNPYRPLVLCPWPINNPRTIKFHLSLGKLTKYILLKLTIIDHWLWITGESNHHKVEFCQLLKTVTVMLVTSLCWWLYDGDWLEMLEAESLCWRLFSLCWRFSQCIKSVTNISNLSPTHLVPNIRH